MKLNNLKNIFKLAILIGGLVLLVFILRKNLRELDQYNYQVNGFYLLASFIILVIATLALHTNWYFITKTLECNLELRKSLTVRIKSEIGKYIPGRVLGYGYLIVYYKGEGKNQLRVLSSSFYELYLSTFSSFLYFTLIHIFISFKLLDPFRFLFIIISIIGILCLLPVFFQKLSDLFCRLFKKERITYKISFSGSLVLLLLYLGYWFLFSLAFFLFVKAFTDIRFLDIFYLSGSFAISAFAGFMAFFLPAGIGAREGALVYLLGILTGNAMAVIISISSRIWIILGDIVLFTGALISGYFGKKSNAI